MKYIYISMLLLFISGCASNIPMPIVTTKTVVVDTPAYLLQPCKVTAPPDKTKYMSADMSGREGLMSDYAMELLLNIANCNAQLSSIQTYQKKEDALYGK